MAHDDDRSAASASPRDAQHPSFREQERFNTNVRRVAFAMLATVGIAYAMGRVACWAGF
jgi:hypothetical protein